VPPIENEIGHFSLALEQHGDNVTGLLAGMRGNEPSTAVNGHVEGDRLILNPSTGLAQLRIIEWSTERDRFGRMSGTFTYDDRGMRRRVELGTAWVTP
jgi:hypothetical protein